MASWQSLRAAPLGWAIISSLAALTEHEKRKAEHWVMRHHECMDDGDESTVGEELC